VSVVVPRGITALSNGVLVDEAKPELDGTVRWSWHSGKAQPTSLTELVVGSFTLDKSTVNGLPVVNAFAAGTAPATVAAAKANLARTAEVLDFESSIFGPYPFDALGAIVVGRRGRFGFEAQTRPVYRSDYISGERRGVPGTVAMAHLLGDQWFAGSVSEARWSDFWLQDGMGAYLELLWGEHLGQDTAGHILQDVYNSIPADDAVWQFKAGDPGPTLADTSALTQLRGGMMFGALRTAVGDDAFFAILREWATTRAYGNGSTEEFIQLSERVSGQPLRDLFTTWLFTLGKPPVGPAPLAAAAGTHQVTWPVGPADPEVAAQVR
jgi:aminopeptidase N